MHELRQLALLGEGYCVNIQFVLSTCILRRRYTRNRNTVIKAIKFLQTSGPCVCDLDELWACAL